MPPTSTVEAFSLTHAQICDGTTSFLTQLVNAVSVGLDMYGVNDASLAADTGNYDNQGDNQTMSRWNWLNFATVTVQQGFLSFPLASTISGRPLDTTTLTAASEVQTLASSAATAGTFTLSYGGQTTAALPYTATNTAIQTALQGLSTIGAGNVTVTGGPANSAPSIFTFAGTLANTDTLPIVLDKTLLTGGTAAAITETTKGSAAGTNYGIDLWHEDSFNVSPKPLMLVLPSKDNAGAVRRLVIGLYQVQMGPIGFAGPSFKDGFKVNYEGTALLSAVDEVGNPFADGKKRIGRLLSVA